MIYWRANGINILPRLFLLVFGYKACLDIARIVEKDMCLAGLNINWDKSDGTPLHERLYLGFDVDLASGICKVPLARWEHLHIDILFLSEFQRYPSSGS
jgi:hypothetical protein